MHVLCTVGAPRPCLFFFFFNDTATTEIYTLSLHDALPIYLQLSLDLREELGDERRIPSGQVALAQAHLSAGNHDQRSEEHTSELQSHLNLVCRLLLEKKKINTTVTHGSNRSGASAGTTTQS